MDVTFGAGTTAAQQALVWDALDSCAYPFNFLSTAVEFDFGSSFDPALHGGKAEAYTDISNLPSSAVVHVNPGILTPGSVYYGGYPFAVESIIHELGHVIGFQLSDSDQQEVCLDVGGDFATNYTLDQTHGNWPYTSSEAVAEIFKDIYLPRNKRAYDNRTKFTLRDYLDFITVMSHAETGGAGGSLFLSVPAPTFGGVAPDGGFPTLAWTGIPIGQPERGLTWAQVLACDLQLILRMIEMTGPDTPGTPDQTDPAFFFLTAVPGVTSMPTYDQVVAALPGHSSNLSGGDRDDFGKWRWTSEDIGQFHMSSLPITLPSDGYLIWGAYPAAGILTSGTATGYGRFPRQGVAELAPLELAADFSASLIQPTAPVINPGFPYGGGQAGISAGPVGQGLVRGKNQARSPRARVPGVSG